MSQQQPWVVDIVPTYKLHETLLARGLRAVFNRNIVFERISRQVVRVEVLSRYRRISQPGMHDNLQYYALRKLTEVCCLNMS